MIPLFDNQDLICHNDTGQKINHFQTNQGHCASCHKKWRLATSDKCQCGKRQMMFHIINSCPQTKLEGGLPQLHLAEDAAV